MSTLVPTPQVILSFGLEWASLFSTYRARSKSEDRSISKFLSNDLEDTAFVFTSNEQGNLLRFKTAWGKGQSDQSSFELEILDPGGRFEDSFFGTFSRGESFNEMYQEVLESRDINLQRAAGRDLIGKRAKLYDASLGDLDANIEQAKARGEFKRTFQRYERYDQKERETGLFGRHEGWGEVSFTSEWAQVDAPVVVNAGGAAPADFNNGEIFYWDNSTGRNGGAEQAYSTDSYFSRSGEYRERTVSRDVWREYYRQWKVVYDEAAIEAYRRNKQNEFWQAIQLEEDTTPYKDKADRLKSLGSAPFTKPFWITFGVGDDAGTFAPAQYVKLVKIDYGLSTKKVRTLTLHFVPSAGILGLEAQPELLKVLRGTDQVEYQAQVVLFNEDKSVAKSPLVAIPELLQRAYSKALGTDTEVEYLTFELEEFIKKKFAEAALTVYHQDFKVGQVNPMVKRIDPTAVDSEGNAVTHYIDVESNSKKDLKKLTDYLVKTIPGGSGGAAAGNAGTIFRENEEHHNVLSETSDLDYTKSNETLIRFYTRVCKIFYKSLGFEYRSWFTDIAGNKIQYYPFDMKLQETNSPSMRAFVRDRRASMAAKVTVKGITTDGKMDPSPGGLARAVKLALARLSGNNRPPILVSYPEEDFLSKWHKANGTEARKTNNVVFLVTSNLYSALVKGHGERYLRKFNNINIDKLKTFVATYGAYFRSSPTIGKVEGLHDPYSYLTAKSRLLGANRLLVTDDSHGKINSAAELETHLRENKIPLFVYGYKNSNILDFKFDLKMWYAQFLRLIPESVKNSLLSAAIKDPNDPKGLLPLALALDLIKTDKSGESLEHFLDKMWDDAEAELVSADGGTARPIRDPWAQSQNYSIDYGSDSATEAATTLLNTADFAAGRSDQDLKAQQAYFSERDAQKGDALRASVLPSREQFKARIKRLLLLVMNEEAYSPKIKVQSSEDSNMLGILNSVQDRLQSQGGFRGTITTLPLFQIMSPTMIGRSSVLYMVEPQVYSNEKLDNTIPYKTWLSGEYWILGYEGNIENGKVTTSFDVVKKPYLRNVTIEE